MEASVILDSHLRRVLTAACVSADAKDGKPHFMHGMQKEIIVK